MGSCGCVGVMPGACGTPLVRSGKARQHMPGDLIALMATGLTAPRQAGPRRPLGDWTRTRLPSGSNGVGESGSPMEAKEGDCGCGGFARAKPGAICVPTPQMDQGNNPMPANTLPLFQT